MSRPRPPPTPTPTPPAGPPPPLPIEGAREEIGEAVRHHQVVVVEGPAGCGKTTGLPGILLDAGLSRRRIGITQPRRIAAVSVAWRLAALFDGALGDMVGYSIRFDDRTSQATRVKVMTDGILLQEVRHDPWLEAYDVVVVDEAHERSLNIDFVLGLLHRALARRGDLKVVVSSATLDARIFQKFFGPVVGEVPHVKVAARTFPVTLRYRPPPSASFDALNEAVVDAVMERAATGAPGHQLVFLAGEASIQRVAVLLEEAGLGLGWRVMPLFGRLKREEQEAVFKERPGVQKVILATNIAETSVTVPNVRAVVDTGLAKVPSFNARHGVTTLREEPISQAAATQRAGRAGRDGPGVVVRLWPAAADATRATFTLEEIRRVDLSEAVLRLIDLGVRDLESFALPTPPPAALLSEAVAALAAMGAITQERELTDIGRRMVPFPLSPPLARMVVEAAMHAPEAMVDVCIIGAFLSVRAPFITPKGQEWEARRAHRRLADAAGDATTALAIFRAWARAGDRPRFCREMFLDPDTLAFIDRAQAQIYDIAVEHGLAAPAAKRLPPPAPAAAVLSCLAKGFANRLLCRRGHTYETEGGLRVALHPSSALFHAPPAFAVAAELMHARRLYAFFVSALDGAAVAEASPRAAAAWGIGAAKRGRRDGPAPTTHLDLGGERLAVEGRRRQVVIIRHGQVAGLLAAQTAPTPAASGLKARLLGPRGETWLSLRLGQLLAALPAIPLPTPDAPRPDLPWGAVLEVDRDLYALGRYADGLGLPAGVPGGGAVGWLVLAHNDAGGFWFQVAYDYGAAVADSAAALHALGQAAEAMGMGDVDALGPLGRARARLTAALSALAG